MVLSVVAWVLIIVRTTSLHSWISIGNPVLVVVLVVVLVFVIIYYSPWLKCGRVCYESWLMERHIIGV